MPEDPRSGIKIRGQSYIYDKKRPTVIMDFDIHEMFEARNTIPPAGVMLVSVEKLGGPSLRLEK